jgi:hypothetical protein
MQNALQKDWDFSQERGVSENDFDMKIAWSAIHRCGPRLQARRSSQKWLNLGK